jgi:hypothetical protein
MKILWLALLVLWPAAAVAAASEQSYLAARDARTRPRTKALPIWSAKPRPSSMVCRRSEAMRHAALTFAV